VQHQLRVVGGRVRTVRPQMETNALERLTSSTHLVRTLVHSTHNKNGNHTRKQVKGLPVCTSPTRLADTHCYRKESSATGRTASTKPQLTQSFFGTYRHTGDVLPVDGPTFDNFLRPVYEQEPPDKPTHPTSSFSTKLQETQPSQTS